MQTTHTITITADPAKLTILTRLRFRLANALHRIGLKRLALRLYLGRITLREAKTGRIIRCD